MLYACGAVCSISFSDRHRFGSSSDAGYGHKHDKWVVFLGDFKARAAAGGLVYVERVIDEDQFVQCIMFNHRVVGAVLVGETDLEETIENLICNETDLER
ncbi:hypothetical protein COOONC_01711 [Cooperia oncophora]